MNVHKCLIFVLMLFASSVFAQNTHMGVPAKDMIVLKAVCSPIHLNVCDSDGLFETTDGSTYDRISADGKLEQDFKIPERKVLVITDWEWTYFETTVMEDSANDAVRVDVGALYGMSISETSLRVTDGSSPLVAQGHASGTSQMTSGFVVGVLPRWRVNRVIVGPDVPPSSSRTFTIILRGYLLDVP